MAPQPEQYIPTHRYTPVEAATAVTTALSQRGADNILASLHGFEFAFADRFEWPWMRWRHLRDDDPAYMAALPEQVPDQPEDLEQTILASALDMRRGGAVSEDGSKDDSAANARAALFADVDALMDASAALGPSLQLELAFAAYHERKWRAVELLALRLMGASKLSLDSVFDRAIRRLLTDMVFFALYRRHMPGYVDNPGHLYGQLTALKDNPQMAEVLGGDTATATLYRANMLAMKGDFGAALPLYATAANTSGFVSPVFPHAQVLLPLEDLTEKSRADDMQWYHERSKTEFVYRHPPSGEHALMVACEQGYFDHYALTYCQIVGQTNPGALIHFHLINFPADRAPTRNRTLEIERQCGVRINYTFEDSEFMAKRPQLKGGVCVCTRYIYLPDYLQAYSGVTITDIDGWLVKSIDDLSAFGEHDSLVSSWIWRKNTGYWRLPWGNLAGGFCSIKSTETSIRFAELVAHYLAQLFQRNAYHGKPLFYADQAAHFLCLNHAREKWGMDVGFIVGGFAQSAELPFQGRNEGKRAAMQAMLAKLKAEG